MRGLLRALVMPLVAATALAVTIDFESPPVVSAEITTFDDHRLASEQELAPEQLQSLTPPSSRGISTAGSRPRRSPPETMQLQINPRP